jgi:hypothetical protein
VNTSQKSFGLSRRLGAIPLDQRAYPAPTVCLVCYQLTGHLGFWVSLRRRPSLPFFWKSSLAVLPSYWLAGTIHSVSPLHTVRFAGSCHSCHSVQLFVQRGPIIQAGLVDTRDSHACFSRFSLPVTYHSSSVSFPAFVQASPATYVPYLRDKVWVSVTGICLTHQGLSYHSALLLACCYSTYLLLFCGVLMYSRQILFPSHLTYLFSSTIPQEGLEAEVP